jgi:RHS repeat-associated protein
VFLGTGSDAAGAWPNVQPTYSLTVNKATPNKSFSDRTLIPTGSGYTIKTSDLDATFVNPYSSQVSQPTGTIVYTIVGSGTVVNAGTSLASAQTYTIRATYQGNENYNSASVDAIFTISLDPLADADGDGLPNGWEQTYFGSTTAGDPNADSDGDGLTNIAEYNLGTNPKFSDAGTSAIGGTVPTAWPNSEGTSTAAVGATIGSLHVDKSGAANYSIPIWTTPGTGGLQPDISLNYSSGSSDGIAGFGWSFSGASAITRGPQTLKTDGRIHGVDLTVDDRFYLDGQRLILISGIYGEAPSEYRTEIDTFTKIVAYGVRGTGPHHFIAWTKAGQIIEFGNTEDSAAEAQGQTEVLSWSANKVSDHAGNFMNFTYSEDSTTGEHLLTQIDYTGNAIVAPYASVRFQYETRPDTFEGYFAGSKTALTKRLKSISSYYGETLARQFTFDYINRDIASGDGLGRSILKTLHEKDGNGTEYPPLGFEYSNPSNGWVALDANTWSPPVPLLSANIAYDNNGHAIYNTALTQGGVDATFIDIDGDGWPDCVRPKVRQSDAGLDLDVWLNKPSGWVLADGTGGRPDFRIPGSLPTDISAVRFTDINGDGLVDVMDCSRGRAYLNTGSGFIANETWSLPDGPPGNPYPFGGWVGGRFVDLNGDGWLDYLATYQIVAGTDENGNDIIETPTAVWLNCGPLASTTLGSGWEYAPQYAGAASGTSAAGFQFLDLNGDKLPDGVWSYKTIDRTTTPITIVPGGIAYRNSGNGFIWTNPDPGYQFTPPTPFVINDGPFKAAYPTELVDLNGDGLVDIISRNEGLSDIGNTNSVWFNTGKAWTAAPAAFQAPNPLVTGGESVTTGSVFLDLNNDGKIDFVRAFEGQSAVHLGTPLGWAAEDTVGLHLLRAIFLSNADISTNVQGITCKGAGSDMIDLNADGAVDQVWYWHQDYTSNHTSAVEAKGAYVNQRVNPDRLTKVTNGFGDSSTITYAPLTERDGQGNPTVYTKGTDSTPGTPNVIAPIYVVKAIQESDGVGGQKEKDYHYGELRSDFLQGNLGFKWMRVTDNSTGIVSETTYSQLYPYIGMPTLETVASGGQTLTETVTNYDNKSLNGGLTRFAFAKDSTTTTHDLNGDFVKAVTTSVAPADIDDYGNVTKSTTATTGGFSKEIVSSYFAADTTNWFISQTDQVVSTSKAPGTADVVQTFSFTYETDTGLQKTVVVEPDNTALALTTTYGYDQFGNKTSEELKGKALTVDNDGNYVVGADTTRTSTAKFDDNGRFPIWQKNALGHQETFDSYDQTLGVLTQASDANGLATSWTYDGFGRKTQENHNVGTTGATKTDIHYRWAATNAPAGSSYFIETIPDGAAPSLAFFDTFGRIRNALSINGDGKIVCQSTTYDNLGRVTATSQPYFNGSPNIYWSGTAAGQFDALNRPLSVYTPDEEAAGGYVSTTFSYNGLTVKATNPNSHVLTTVKNELGQVVQSIRDDKADTTALDYTKVLYVYDAVGNLVGTNAAGVSTIVDYDIRGRKIAMSDPDMGDWKYRYNVFGELIWQKDAKGQITTLAYDALGRQTSRVETEGTTIWTYDTAADGTGTWKGKLSSVASPGSYSETYSYDSFGRPATVSRTIDGTQYDVSQTYDSVGRPDRTTYPTGFQTQNVYNGLGVLKEVRRSDSNRNDLYWMADSFAVTGQVNGEILGNGLVNDRTYSPVTGRLGSAAIGRGTEIAAPYSIQDLHYEYDPMGNVLTRSDVPTNRSESFTYDGLERILTNTLTGTVSSSLTVAYDQMGNITSKSDLGAYTYNYVPSGRTTALPHAVSSAGANSYTYDADGNMLDGNGRTLSWTSFNQVKRIDMTGGKFSEFSFGAAHERVKEVSHTGTTIYVGTLFEKVTGLGANPLVENKHYIFTPTGRVAVRTERSDNTVDTKYFHTDGLGSITVVTSETGAVVKRFAFDVWGRRLDPATNQVITSSTSAGVTRGYTDHEQLDDLGLVHMNGRVYDPMLGRFLSSDPTVQSVSDSQTYNRYSYCSNNPLNKTDPTGFTAQGGSWWEKFWNAIKTYGQFLATPTGQGDDGTGSGNSSQTTTGASQLHGSIIFYTINPFGFNGVIGTEVKESPDGMFNKGKSRYVVVRTFVVKSVSSPKSDSGESVPDNAELTQGHSDFYYGLEGFRQSYVDTAARLSTYGLWSPYSHDMLYGTGRINPSGDIKFANPQQVGARWGQISQMVLSIGFSKFIGSMSAAGSGAAPLTTSSQTLVVVDENVSFMARPLSEQGFNVVQPIPGTPDAALRSLVEETDGILITRNYKDFKGLNGVIRVGGQSLSEQFRLTLNSLNAAEINPEIWTRMNQIPASGLNKGTLNPP